MRGMGVILIFDLIVGSFLLRFFLTQEAIILGGAAHESKDHDGLYRVQAAQL